jgi:hypothetical protein
MNEFLIQAKLMDSSKFLGVGREFWKNLVESSKFFPSSKVPRLFGEYSNPTMVVKVGSLDH